jgi:restriction system protein
MLPCAPARASTYLLSGLRTSSPWEQAEGREHQEGVGRVAARRKSVAQMLFEAQQRKAKQKAAEEKAEKEARLKAEAAAARAAAAEELRRKKAEDVQMRQKQAQDDRRLNQVLREMAKRDEQRIAQEARQARGQERQAVADVHTAQRLAAERLRQQAIEETEDLDHRVETLSALLVHRTRGLEDLRVHTDAAFAEGGIEAYTEKIVEIFGTVEYLDRATIPPRVAYVPETRRLTVEIDLPRKTRVPADKARRYVAAQRGIVTDPRKPAEIQQIYQDLIGRFTLCVADYAAAATSPELVGEIAVNGYVRTKDKATGQPANPCLVTFLAERAVFEQLVLDEPELDPGACLRHLSAVLSANPFDLEPVVPIVDFDLQRFKLVEESALLTGLDSRIDLSTMDPYDFERLVRQLFEAMGYRAWRTRDSRDDGIDAVAIKPDSIVADHCVIQAKRYKNTVSPGDVRALFGSMDQLKAATGVVVTTSSFGPSSYEFARQSGRISLIDGPKLKHLLMEHLGLDVLISLPKAPRRSSPASAAPGALPAQGQQV